MHGIRPLHVSVAQRIASVPCEDPGRSGPLLRRTLRVSGSGEGWPRGPSLVSRHGWRPGMHCTDELRRREYRPDVFRSRTGSRRLISVPDLGVDDRRSFMLGGFPQALDDTLGGSCHQQRLDGSGKPASAIQR
jgi:hypothetical protein